MRSIASVTMVSVLLSLLTLFAAIQPGHPEGIMGCIVSLVLTLVGIVILLIPAKQMLEWDRRSGYWVYQRELKASGDKKRAVAKAAAFYRAFGACFIVMGTSSFFTWLWVAFQ